MPQTEPSYEIVGKFIRVSREDAVTFIPINPEIQSYTFHNNPIDGMKIGSELIRGISPYTGQKTDVKPSYEEFKNNIMKMIGVSASGGRKVTKTRRRVRIV